VVEPDAARTAAVDQRVGRDGRRTRALFALSAPVALLAALPSSPLLTTRVSGAETTPEAAATQCGSDHRLKLELQECVPAGVEGCRYQYGQEDEEVHGVQVVSA
jgi:hypothetical protein